MFGLMPRRRERTALATRGYNPFELFGRDFGPLGEWFPTWALEPLWEEPFGVTTEERENEMVVRAEVPGFEPNEIDVTLQGNELTMRAEHAEPAGGEAKEERRQARFVGSLTLPAGVEPEKMEARCHNGVLEVHVPRTPEAKPRRIEVKT